MHPRRWPLRDRHMPNGSCDWAPALAQCPITLATVAICGYRVRRGGVSRSRSTARFRRPDRRLPHSSHARGRIGERSDGPPRTTGAPWRVRAISSRRRALRLGQCGRREGARDLQRVRGGAAAHRRALGSRRRRVGGAAVRCVGPIAQGACSLATARTRASISEFSRLQPLRYECSLFHPFIGRDHARIQMPRGASNLGGGGRCQAPRLAPGGRIGLGVWIRSELLAVRGRRGTVMLDDEDIEAIADRVAAKLRPRTDGLVGVRDVARALGMSCAWVYRNADELGAQRLGTGRKPALRFDLALTVERARGLGTEASTPLARSQTRGPGRPRNGSLSAGIELITPRASRRP